MLFGALIAAGVAIAAGVVRAQSKMPVRNHLMRRSRQGAGTALRIVLIGGPILLVFLVLFASADAVFEDQVSRLTNFDLSSVAPHVWARFETRYGNENRVTNFFFSDHSRARDRRKNLEAEISVNYRSSSGSPLHFRSFP